MRAPLTASGAASIAAVTVGWLRKRSRATTSAKANSKTTPHECSWSSEYTAPLATVVSTRLSRQTHAHCVAGRPGVEDLEGEPVHLPGTVRRRCPAYNVPVLTASRRTGGSGSAGIDIADLAADQVRAWHRATAHEGVSDATDRGLGG